MPAEDVAVRRTPLFNRVLQRASDVLLPNYIGELLRAIFAGQDLVANGKINAIIRDEQRRNGCEEYGFSALPRPAFGFTLLLDYFWGRSVSCN